MMKIPLTQEQFAIIDHRDFAEFGYLKWHAKWNKGTRSFYAARSVSVGYRKQKTIFLAREIIGVTEREIEVDHKNRNTLDCRRMNLRVVTKSQNAMNRSGARRDCKSGFRGVVFHPHTKKWRAQIGIGGKNKHLGLFVDKSDAAAAYAVANREHFGEYGGKF